MRFPRSDTALRIHLARFVVASLRDLGVLRQRTAGSDCSICFGTYRCDLGGSSRWRLAMPCGHWTCQPCDAQARAVWGQQCPQCQQPMAAVAIRAFPGKCA